MMERPVLVAIAQADLFLRDAWPWLAAALALFGVTVWIMWTRK